MIQAQDKKTSIDLYYKKYERSFPEGPGLAAQLSVYLEWLARSIPNFSKSRLRKPVDLYALVGALEELAADGVSLRRLGSGRAGHKLEDFERRLKATRPGREEARYLAAAARQTDNIRPRETRIDVFARLLAP